MATKQEIIDRLSQCGGLSYQDWIRLLDSIYFDGEIGDVYLPTTSNILPQNENSFTTFSIITEGTYTQSNGSPIVVPEGHIAIISNYSGVWVINRNPINVKGDPMEAVDDLISTSTTLALSANMGRELNSKIGGIVDRLPNALINIPVIWANESKYLYAVDGRMINSSSANAKVSDFIDIESFGDYIELIIESQINANTVCAVCYYSSDEEDDFVSSQFINTTGGNVTFTGSLNKPVGASHVRFCTYQSDNFKLKKTVLGSAVDVSRVEAIESEIPNKVSVSDFNDEVNNLNETIQDISDKLPKVWKLSDVTLNVSGSVVNVNGNHINSSLGRRTNFIAFDKTKKYKLETQINNNTIVPVAYYQTDAINGAGQPTTFISAQGAISTTPPPNVIVTIELEFPDNANYLRFSGYDANVFKLYIEDVGNVASTQQVEIVDAKAEEAKEAVFQLESIVNVKNIIGADVQAEVKRYLDERNINIANSPINPDWYGIEYIEENPDPNVVTRIASNMALHIKASGLPIQKKLRRCILNANGTVNYYLHPNDSNLKADGVSPSKLDGTDGNYMVEIPPHWRKVTGEITTFGGNPAIKINSKISEYYQDDTWEFIGTTYSSAVEATVNWDTGKAASVCTTIFKSGTYTGWGNNAYRTEAGVSIPQSSQLLTKTALAVDGYTTNATTYRGSSNRASLDDFRSVDELSMPTYDSSYNLPIANVTSAQQANILPFIKTGLGRPLSNTHSRGRIFWREKARANGKRYNIHMYDNAVTLYWLATIEYATRNLQQPINNTADANGYTQGGLGMGASSMVFNDYEGFKGHPDDPAAVGLIPCGVTNSLGNNSGEVPYYIPYYPYGTGSGQGGTWALAGYKPFIVNVMSYRGVENFYGHMYKVMDGINVQMNQTWRKRNSSNTGYESEYASVGVAKADIRIFYTPYASAYGEWINEYYNKLDDILTDDYCIFYIKNLAIGNKGFGHIFPKATAGKSNFHYCDITEFYVKDEQQSLTGKICYPTIAGRLVNGEFCGALFTFVAQSGNETRASDTTRLDYR